MDRLSILLHVADCTESELIDAQFSIIALLTPPFDFSPLDAPHEYDSSDPRAWRSELTDEVRRWLPRAREGVKAINANLSQLHTQFRAAKLQAFLAEILIAQASVGVHQAWAPVRPSDDADHVDSEDPCLSLAVPCDLPFDIICAIMYWTIRSVSRQQRASQIVMLSLVSKTWKELTVQAGLWTFLDIVPRPGQLVAAPASIQDRVTCIVERSNGRLLDLCFSAEIIIPAHVLSLVVAASTRFGRAELRSPELFYRSRQTTVDGPPKFYKHPLLRHLPLNAPYLRELKLEGHARRGRFQSLDLDHALWQQERPEARDTIQLFCNTSLLDDVHLDYAYFPEQTLALPWHQLRVYREVNTTRDGPMPPAFLMRMHVLQELYLTGVRFHDPNQFACIELSTVTTFTLELDASHPDFKSSVYDRLGALTLPALKHLTVRGSDFATIPRAIHACILDLWERSARPQLLSLSLCLSTGLKDTGALQLLRAFNRLESFTVEQGPPTSHGILTENFLARVALGPVNVQILKIEGGLGYPEHSPGVDVDHTSWVNRLVIMLRALFATKLRMMDLRPAPCQPRWSRRATPFDKRVCARLQALVKWSPNQTILVWDSCQQSPPATQYIACQTCGSDDVEPGFDCCREWVHDLYLSTTR